MINDKRNILEEYLEKHQNDFYILAYGYVKNRDAALDIVQESAYKALKSVRNLKDVSAIKTWFYRILVNTTMSYLRKNKRIIYSDQLPEIAANVQTELGEDVYQLYEAVDQLKPKLKTVIILRYFEDMKIEDIAEILNSNVSTVKSRIYNALEKMRIIMNERGV